MKKYKIIGIICLTVLIGITAVNIAFYQTMVQVPLWVGAVMMLAFIASSVVVVYSSVMHDKAKKEFQTEKGTYSKKKYIIGEIWDASLVVISFHVILIILDIMGIRFPYHEESLRGFLIADIVAVPAAIITSFMKFNTEDEKTEG